MGNFGIMFMLIYSMIITIAGVYANDNAILMPSSYEKPELTVEEWFQRLDQAKETKTKLHFYLQDALRGDNPTVWEVAESKITSTSPTSFGQVLVIDDLLISGPEADSEIVGRAQGIVGLADLHNVALHESVNIVFTEGKYKGSAITILGRNPLFDKVRELPIIGGTGAFRMARGIVVTNTHTEDPVVSVYEYTLYVYHYSS
ncbi:hypothetical protein BUALT_Bualt06G0076100 [Buddleja alternifolia]|uniref:Dirigent protein n=1 Tax=Buddleja alternifolia TaxID=168488 RepID=A0AAV6XPF9_9LAMI|nr:hypothetical protein BUALT_Bualt06G0076100 [Buddleja alternifolia]